MSLMKLETKDEMMAEIAHLRRDNNRLKMEGPEWAVRLCQAIALHLPGETDPIAAVQQAAQDMQKMQWAYQELSAQIDSGTIPVVSGNVLAN